jgi:hypothetical protein
VEHDGNGRCLRHEFAQKPEPLGLKGTLVRSLMPVRLPPGRLRLATSPLAVQAGKSCATVESGKWVGPAKIAFDAEVVEANAGLTTNPQIANDDPYGAGWMVRVRPGDWAAAKANLIAGTACAAPYEAKMTADNFGGCA